MTPRALAAWTLAAWALALSTLAAACRSRPPEQAAPSAKVETCVGPRDEDEMIAALERCRDGLAIVAEGASFYRIFSERCTELYSRPACRAAWGEYASQTPESWMRGVAAACARDYCPSLPGATPPICAASSLASLSPTDFEIRFTPLHEAILRCEFAFSRDVDEVVRFASLFRTNFFDEHGNLVTPSANMRIVILSPTHGGGITVASAGKTWSLPYAPAPADFAPVFEALADAPRDATLVLLVKGRLLPAQIQTATAAARAAGFTEIAFSISH